MSIRTRTLAAALALSLTVLVAACGEDDGGAAERPTVEQLSIKFRNEMGATPEQGECLAGYLVSSDISDEALAEMYAKQLPKSALPFADADLSKEDDDALGALGDDLNACIGKAPLTAPPPASTLPPSSAPGSTAPATSAGDPGAGTTASTQAEPSTTVPPDNAG